MRVPAFIGNKRQFTTVSLAAVSRWGLQRRGVNENPFLCLTALAPQEASAYLT